MTDQDPNETQGNTDENPESNAAEDALKAAQEAISNATSQAGESTDDQPTPEEQAMLDMAKAAVGDAVGTVEQAESASPESEPQPVDFPAIQPGGSAASNEEISLLNDVNLNVTIELGRTRLLVEDVLKLGSGAIVELDKLAGDPVDVFVNERLVARGEVLVLNDSFCVRISEILSLETIAQGT